MKVASVIYPVRLSFSQHGRRELAAAFYLGRVVYCWRPGPQPIEFVTADCRAAAT